MLVGVVKDRISFSDPEFHRRELTLYASRNATREDFDTVVAAMRAGKIPTAAQHAHLQPRGIAGGDARAGCTTASAW